MSYSLKVKLSNSFLLSLDYWQYCVSMYSKFQLQFLNCLQMQRVGDVVLFNFAYIFSVSCFDRNEYQKKRHTEKKKLFKNSF